MQEKKLVLARDLEAGQMIRILLWGGWSWQKIIDVQIITEHTMYVETEVGTISYIPDCLVQMKTNREVG